MGRYAQEFDRSLSDPEAFWGDAAKDIDWYQAPSVVLDASSPPFYRWFADGTLNTCFNALDRHVRDGRGNQAALIYDSPVTGRQRTYTYTELRDEVARFAGVLRGLGVAKGDRVIIYLPMIPEAAIAMLACARIGAVHSVVFGGFAAAELATRIDDAAPKVMVSASCGIEGSRVIEYKPILDRAIDLARHKPHHCVILQRPQAQAALTAGRDLDWAEAVAGAEPADCVPVAATDPLYILYTSGTTARPKGVVRDNGGHAVALRWTMNNIYDTGPGEVFWAASDVGWVVGHSYIVYAPLLAGCTTVLYEGKPVGTPDAGAFWRVIAEHKVKALFTAPTAFRAIKKEDPDGDLARTVRPVRLRYLFLAGERLDPETYSLGRRPARHPGHRPLVADRDRLADRRQPDGPRSDADQGRLPHRAGTRLRRPHPGRRRHRAKPGQTGEIVVRLPLPPGCLPTLWHDDERFVASYLSAHPGYYVTGDGGLPRHRRLPVRDGPHRRRHQRGRPPAVHRADGGGAGQPSGGGRVRGHRRARFLQGPDTARVRGAQGGRQRRSPPPSPPSSSSSSATGSGRSPRWQVDVVAALPKTRSGKILRKTMRGIADGDEDRCPPPSKTRPSWTRCAPSCSVTETRSNGTRQVPWLAESASDPAQRPYPSRNWTPNPPRG